ncbi:hypothetical protein [Oryza sativa Japonica Group]|uniref:Uncharacterized protein n=2 Tax=Oryza sativa subsp. japonica TaxID=39947 RepID=Q5ZDQ7_ORYSJ|nr:hypothetical protein [Oryza sativa Japonica Group]BAD54725.1 hypothetical protein [Oryza sativa Japonica Group]
MACRLAVCSASALVPLRHRLLPLVCAARRDPCRHDHIALSAPRPHRPATRAGAGAAVAGESAVWGRAPPNADAVGAIGEVGGDAKEDIVGEILPPPTHLVHAAVFAPSHAHVSTALRHLLSSPLQQQRGRKEKDETISGLHMFPRVSDGSLRRSFLLPGDAATRRGSLHRPRWQGPTWAKAHQRSSSRACGKATEEERQHTAARVVAAEQRHGPRRQVEDGKLDVSIVEPGRASFISRQLLNVMANLFDPLTMRSSLATVRHGSREQNSGFALASGASITQVDIDGEMLVP